MNHRDLLVFDTRAALVAAIGILPLLIATSASALLNYQISATLTDSGGGLADQFGQSVIVENRAGASGTLGVEAAWRTTADNYTFLLSPAAAIANAAFGTKTPYDIEKDFAPVISFVELPMLLAANNDTPYKTATDYLNAVKAAPEKQMKITVASGGCAANRRASSSVPGPCPSTTVHP